MKTPATAAHTAEPWKACAEMSGYARIWAAAGYILIDLGARVSAKDAERIVTCVNACAGIAEPEAVLAKVREGLAEIAGHFYTHQDSARCREIAKELLAALTAKGAV